jgi:hypothetical protein
MLDMEVLQENRLQKILYIQYLDESVVEAESQVVLLGLVQPQPAHQPVRRIRSHLHLQLSSVPVKSYL